MHARQIWLPIKQQLSRSLKGNWFSFAIINITPPTIELSCLVAVDNFCYRNLAWRMRIGDLQNWWPLGPAEALIYGRKALQPNLNKAICLACHVNNYNYSINTQDKWLCVCFVGLLAMAYMCEAKPTFI